MRTLALVLLFVVVTATGVYAQALTVNDFYAPVPSRESMDYREALSHFSGQRFLLHLDKDMGYTTYGYLYTREMVKDHIQALIDEFNIDEPEIIQDLIDRYAYFTPEEGQMLIFTYFEGPHMENRFYKDLLDDWPNYVSFEYGVGQIQNRIEQLRDRIEYFEDKPVEEEMIFTGGIKPIKFHYTEDWLWTIKPEWSELDYRRVSNAYEYRFEFWFNDKDRMIIRELIDNKIMPTMRLVSGRKDMYAVEEFDNRMISWVVRTIDPEYFEEIMAKQLEKTWEGAPIDDPNFKFGRSKRTWWR
ncbi:hypothetical protein J7K50_01150 [bacterium]|nr:hypothetical protein [bacterium]